MTKYSLVQRKGESDEDFGGKLLMKLGGGFLANATMYAYLSSEFSSEIALTPVVTNISSGLYVFGKNQFNKAKDELEKEYLEKEKLGK